MWQQWQVLFLCSETALATTLPLAKALKDCIARPHCKQITWEGDFSFPFLKLDSSVCASTTEIETLAGRGSLRGDLSYHIFQTGLWTHSPCAGIWQQAVPGASIDSETGLQMLASRGGWFVLGGSLSTMNIYCFPSRCWCQSIWSKRTNFPTGLLTNVLNWLRSYSQLLVHVSSRVSLWCKIPSQHKIGENSLIITTFTSALHVNSNWCLKG